MGRASRITVIAISTIMTAAVAAQAASVNWIGPASGGAWEVGANWSTSSQPGASDMAVFSSNTSVESTSPTVAQIGGAGIVTLNSGTLNVTGSTGNAVNLPNGFIIASSATLITPGADRSLSQVVTVNGTQDLNNNGTGWGYLAGSGVVNNALTNSQQQLTLDQGGNKTSTFSGSITGKLFVDVRGGGAGSGRQVLMGASSYTGITLLGDFGVAGQPNVELQLAGGNNRLPSSTSLFMGNGTTVTKVKLILGDSGGASNQTVAGLFSYAASGANVSVVGGNANVSNLTAGDGSNWDFNGVLGGSAANENNLAITKAGSGAISLFGVNTYAGDTTINQGTVILADNAGLRFVIGANGVNNKITGTGSVTLNGDFTFDLTNANTTSGNSWNIVDVATLNETFGATFTVNGFTENNNVWTQMIGNTEYDFSEATGVLTVQSVPEPAALGALVLGGFVLARKRRS